MATTTPSCIDTPRTNIDQPTYFRQDNIHGLLKKNNKKKKNEKNDAAKHTHKSFWAEFKTILSSSERDGERRKGLIMMIDSADNRPPTAPAPQSPPTSTWTKFVNTLLREKKVVFFFRPYFSG